MTERMIPWNRGLALAALSLLVLSTQVVAQYVASPPPAAYALENVTVVHPDGTLELGVNIVVRRGLIAAMGQGVEIPPDAVVLEGDSLFTYPGMIDAQGNAQLELPDATSGPGVLPWDPPRDAQGFTPHRLAASYLVGIGADGGESRKAGVIAAGIHPEGGMAPGQSTAVLFRTDAKVPGETVAVPSVGLFFSFQGARGVFPGTLFAVMAHFRQNFEDASREGLIQSEYAQSPLGMTLPRWDPDFEVLRQVAAGQMPVFFMVNSAGDIRRVFGLADEIGFSPIIVGGAEAWKVADELQSRGTPVLVSVDFPTPREWEPPEAGDEESVELEDAAEEVAEEMSVEEDLTPAAAREKKRLENLYANAGRLVDAGVTIALTSGGGGGDFREGVTKAIEYGLSESAALTAVTVAPATILGIPSLVTYGEGMAANFIATDGPLFDGETAIRYTFVEGGLERGREVRSGGGEAPAVDVSGSWDVVVTAEGMEMPFEMTLTQEGASFSGSMASPDFGEAEIAGGNVSGNTLIFSMVVSMGAESMEMEGTATVEGDRMSGSIDGVMGNSTFTATRNPGSEGGVR